MVKKFDQLPGQDQGDKGLSREDRKNQQIHLMFQKQERARQRKEERKTNQKEQRSTDFIKPQSGRSHAPLPHKPVPGRGSNYQPSSRNLPTHQPLPPHHRNQIPGFGALTNNQPVKSKDEGDYPPIKLNFAKNVEKTPSNTYFFRRKESFEKRELTKQQELLEQQQQRMLLSLNNPDSTQQFAQNQAMREAQLQHVLQHQQYVQQAQIAAQGGGIPRAAINSLAPQGFIPAGTGGMYDPIISGGDSSLSSASKSPNYQAARAHQFNQINPLNYVQGAQHHMRPVMGQGHSLFGHAAPPTTQGTIQPLNGAFVAHSDSSEVMDSSDDRAVLPIQTKVNMQHITAPGKVEQKAQPAESDEDEEEMKLILEKTKEAQRKLKQAKTEETK